MERNTAMQYTYFALFHTVASCKYCTFSTGTYVIYIFGEKHFVCLMPIKHFVLYCISCSQEKHDG